MTWSVASTNYNQLASGLLPLTKLNLRINFPDDDVLILSKIKGAISAFERYSGWRVFPATINWRPVESGTTATSSYQCPTQPVSAFTLHSGAVDLSAGYELRSAAATDPVWLANIAGQPFPADALSVLTVGYATADQLAPEIENCVLQLAATAYEYRETVALGGPEFVPGWMNDIIAGIWIPRA